MAVVPAPEAPTHEPGGARFTSLATPASGSSDTSVWLVEITPGTPATPHELVERFADPDDARAKNLRLTDRGRAARRGRDDLRRAGVGVGAVARHGRRRAPAPRPRSRE